MSKDIDGVRDAHVQMVFGQWNLHVEKKQEQVKAMQRRVLTQNNVQWMLCANMKEWEWRGMRREREGKRVGQREEEKEEQRRSGLMEHNAASDGTIILNPALLRCMQRPIWYMCVSREVGLCLVPFFSFWFDLTSQDEGCCWYTSRSLSSPSCCGSIAVKCKCAS